MRERMRIRRRRAAVLALLAVATLLVGVDLVRGGAPQDPAPTPSVAAEDGPVAEDVATPSGTAPAVAGRSARVPERGAGTFTVAPGGTPVVGKGQLLRYEVRVENGIRQNAKKFAAAVDATLGDPRSWTRGGEWSFQRVSSGTPDFVITLASPDTTDRLCLPLDTQGYTSCRIDNMVVVNLARWMLAVPEFEGELATYRLYVVNHEVGHRLSQGHVGCPGPGKLAPVMQQQTLGLKGCTPNPWPYVNGTRITGPPAD
jgi:hypothetical protein